MSKLSHKKEFLALFSVVATELIGFGLIIPILPQIASSFGTSSLSLGFLMAAFSLAQFIAAPLLGSLSDRIGRRPVLIMSKIGTVGAYLLMAFTNSYLWFLVSRLLDGFTGGNISTARAYVADITRPEDRSRGMAVIGISFGIGFILGPALGALLYNIGPLYGHSVPALTAGFLSFVALLFTILFLKEPVKRTESRSAFKELSSFGHILKMPEVQIICLVQLVFMVVFSGFETTFAIFTHTVFGFTERQNSLLFVYSGLLGLVVQGAITRRSSSRPRLVVLGGLVIVAVSFALLACSRSLVSLLIALALLSLGVGVMFSFLPAILSLHAESRTEGRIMGVYESIGSLSRIIGPIFAFSIFHHFIEETYLIFSFIIILILAVFGSVVRLRQTAEPALEQKNNQA